MNERFGEVRREIEENDASIVASVNRRLDLVAELWAAKTELGLDMVDPDRERRLRDLLAATNDGRLSQAGLDMLVTHLLDLTKRELGPG